MPPSHPDLVAHLTQVIGARLLDPLEILLDGDSAVATLRRRVERHASELAHRLLDGDRPQVVATAARLVAALYPGDETFDPPPDWWRTPLGQVVAHRVGHPTADSVSYPVAGAMLGITRQGVHDLLNRGRLTRHPDGGVATSSIQARLQLRVTEEGRPHHA